MKCFDPQTNVYYPQHDELVRSSGADMVAMGVCSRCGITLNPAREYRFNTIDELDNFVDTFGEVVQSFDRVSKTAIAEISETDYDFWCDSLPE